MNQPDLKYKIVQGQRVTYVDAQAQGAIPNGARFVKVAGEPDDTHALGEMGVVIGGVGPIDPDDLSLPEKIRGGYGYWVAWDDMPDIPVFLMSYKIAQIGAPDAE